MGTIRSHAGISNVTGSTALEDKLTGRINSAFCS
jgi:hypothetical protein